MGWNEFLFGSKESRARSKEVLKEMRPQYERPKIGGAKSDPTPKNPNNGLGAMGRKADPMPKNPNNGLGMKAAPPKPKAKPAMPAAAAPKPKAKPAMPATSKSNFKGNWKGAAPSEMQARGGARLKETATQRMKRMQRERGVGSR